MIVRLVHGKGQGEVPPKTQTLSLTVNPNCEDGRIRQQWVPPWGVQSA